ncbi:hypothetical protein [Cohnella soli]|uniref:Uncharacterized protein n=1 Tax=Cohnella soli TaxID=425005 RepID=A0ABW0HPH1_9BACL
MYQIQLMSEFYPIEYAAQARKLHTISVRIDIDDDDIRADLEQLLQSNNYGLHLYRRARWSWLPVWHDDRISVMDIEDLKTLTYGSSKSIAFAEAASANAKFNIGEFKTIDAKFHFNTEVDLKRAELLIGEAIKRFIDRVISRGPYPDQLRLFQLTV